MNDKRERKKKGDVERERKGEACRILASMSPFELIGIWINSPARPSEGRNCVKRARNGGLRNQSWARKKKEDYSCIVEKKTFIFIEESQLSYIITTLAYSTAWLFDHFVNYKPRDAAREVQTLKRNVAFSLRGQRLWHFFFLPFTFVPCRERCTIVPGVGRETRADLLFRIYALRPVQKRRLSYRSK